MPKKHVDPVPELTPDKLKENEAFQKDMRSRFELKPVRDHGDRSIAANLRRIEQFQGQLGTANDDDKILLARRITALRDETALYLRQKGRFEDAARIASNPGIRREAKAFIEAKTKPDDEWCDHPKWIETRDGQVPNYSREFDFVRDGQKLSMLRCAECGFRNAAPLPKDMQNLIEARAKIREKIIANDMKLPEGTNITLDKLANG